MTPLIAFCLTLAQAAPNTGAPALELTPTPQDLVGGWIYREDLTPGREAADRRPNQGARFDLALEEGLLRISLVRPPLRPYVAEVALDGVPAMHEEPGVLTAPAANNAGSNPTR